MPYYSDKVYEYARNAGKMESPNYISSADLNGSADYLEFLITIDGTKINTASITVSGCGTTIAALSVLTDLVIGPSISESKNIDASTMISELDQIPEDKKFCVDFALTVLKQST